MNAITLALISLLDIDGVIASKLNLGVAFTSNEESNNFILNETLLIQLCDKTWTLIVFWTKTQNAVLLV